MRIDIEPLIDEAPLGALQWRVLLLCALAAFLDGYDITAVSQAALGMAPEWHVSSGDLTLILTASVIGIAISALLVAPLGDYFGRRTVLLSSFLVVGITTLMTATTHADDAGLWRLLSFDGLLGPKLAGTGANQMLVWRFLTGLGLGASLPNALALGAEYAPKRSRTAMVSLLACAISLGSFSSGQLAPVLTHLGGGWRAIFVAGGGVALLALLPLLALPESPRFLVARGADPAQIKGLLKRLGAAYSPSPEDHFALEEGATARIPIGQLFAGRLLPATLLLWLVFFLNLGMLYLISTWLPSLLREWLPVAQAQRTSSLFQLGGVGYGLVLAALIRLLGPYRLLIVSYTLAALALLFVSSHPAGALLAVTVLFVGCINGAQVGLNALSATLYPTSARASGVGWALGVGRFGAILGPVAAGTLLTQGASAGHLLWLVAFPALGCAAAVAALWMAVARTTEPIPKVATSP